MDYVYCAVRAESLTISLLSSLKCSRVSRVFLHLRVLDDKERGGRNLACVYGDNCSA